MARTNVIFFKPERVNVFERMVRDHIGNVLQGSLRYFIDSGWHAIRQKIRHEELVMQSERSKAITEQIAKFSETGDASENEAISVYDRVIKGVAAFGGLVEVIRMGYLEKKYMAEKKLQANDGFVNFKICQDMLQYIQASGAENSLKQARNAVELQRSFNKAIQPIIDELTYSVCVQYAYYEQLLENSSLEKIARFAAGCLQDGIYRLDHPQKQFHARNGLCNVENYKRAFWPGKNSHLRNNSRVWIEKMARHPDAKLASIKGPYLFDKGSPYLQHACVFAPQIQFDLQQLVDPSQQTAFALHVSQTFPESLRPLAWTGIPMFCPLKQAHSYSGNHERLGEFSSPSQAYEHYTGLLLRDNPGRHDARRMARLPANQRGFDSRLQWYGRELNYLVQKRQQEEATHEVAMSNRSSSSSAMRQVDISAAATASVLGVLASGNKPEKQASRVAASNP